MSRDAHAGGFEPIIVTSELEDVESQQLGLGNSSTVGTAQSSKFSVTTTVQDVRRGVFKDGRDPGIEHAGAVVVFHFDFGLHRVSKVNIELSVDEADVGGDGGDQADEAQLLIKERYPREARGSSTKMAVSQAITASIKPSVAGLSGGSIQVGRSTTETRVGAVTLRSSIVGEMAMAWELKEDQNAKMGIPSSLACAVLLQTDGVPFELEAKFTAPLYGKLYRAKPNIVVGQKHLWERRGRDSWESTAEWTDFDSQQFKDWIRRKTVNEWAETARYQDDES